MNIVIPMAGLGSRFVEAGYRDPKPFIRIPELDNITMLEVVLRNVIRAVPKPKIYLVINPSHYPYLQATGLLDRYPIAVVSAVAKSIGAAANVLRAGCSFADTSEPLMIANSDQWMRYDASHFYDDMFNSKLHGSILTFESKDPKWSYVKCNEQTGYVTEVAEKIVISDTATCGVYIFRHGSYFMKFALDMIAKNIRVNGEFYVCPVFNEMISAGYRIGIYQVDEMWGMGTPQDLEETREKKFKRLTYPFGL